MAEPMFDMVVEGVDELIGTLDILENIEDSEEFEQSMLDCAMVIEARAKVYLRKYIYDLPEHGYRRKHGAGLFGKTMATKKVSKSKGTLTTAVGSFIFYAPYVHYGTGIFAKDGKGRKTPWIYEDADGKFHRTVGQKPKPYLVNALIDSKDEVVQILASGI